MQVVFSCSNQHYKMDPAVFAAWMRILSRVPGSVRWGWGPVPPLAAALGGRGVAAKRHAARRAAAVGFTMGGTGWACGWMRALHRVPGSVRWGRSWTGVGVR